MSLSEGKISLEHHLGSGIALDPVAFENKGLLPQLVLKFTGSGLKVWRSELRNSNCFPQSRSSGDGGNHGSVCKTQILGFSLFGSS